MLAEAEPKPRRRQDESLCGAPVARFGVWVGPFEIQGVLSVGLHKTILFCMGLVEAAAEFYPEARWQRCVVHWYRNIFSDVPTTKVKEVAAMLKAIHAQEDAASAQAKATAVMLSMEQVIGQAGETDLGEDD